MRNQQPKYTSGEKALTHEEYNKLLKVITDIEDELMIRLCVATGLRREDLCNIECDNLKLKEKTLLFHEQKKDRRVRNKDKTYTGEVIEMWRTIDIPNDIIVLINKFYNSLNKATLKKRKYVFSYVGRTAHRQFWAWCDVAGIERRPIHALRATCIKFAHEAGWKDEAISKLTGDKIATIQAHYMTPSTEEMKQITNNMQFA